MDLMTLLMDGIASETSIKTIGKKSNSSPDQVSAILMSAVPMLISQMQKNAESETGASKLSKALDAHAKDDVTNISDFLKNANTEDGAKILNHIMGSKKDTEKVEKNLAVKTGLKTSQVAGILALVAPLLLSYLGKEKQSTQSAKPQKKEESGDFLASMLGSVLTGGSSSSGLDIGSLISFAMKDADQDGKSDLSETIGKLLGGRKLF